jgi:replicative DNA helicase
MQDMEDGIAPDRSAGAPVAFFSLEMSADQLATRILAEQSRISSEVLRMGKISQQEFRNLARAAASCRACRSTSTTRRGSPSRACAPAPAA